jgi:hypothetical protein
MILASQRIQALGSQSYRVALFEAPCILFGEPRGAPRRRFEHIFRTHDAVPIRICAAFCKKCH